MKTLLYCCVGIVFFNLFSCSNKDTTHKQAPEASSEYSTDIKSLSKEFNVIGQPLSVKWLKYVLGTYPNSLAPGPTDYNIIAIVEYNSKDFQEIISLIDTTTSFNEGIYLQSSLIKGWFSESIKNSFVLENNYLRVKPKVYKPESLVGEHFGGFLFFTQDNKIFLYLTRR